MAILPRKVGCISLCSYSDSYFIRKITRGISAIRYLGGDSLDQFTGDVIWCEFVVFMANRFALRLIKNSNDYEISDMTCRCFVS